MMPHFENPKGYTLVQAPEKSSWWTAIYEFTLANENPLTFVRSNETRIRPARHYFTDQGSIPRFPPFIRAFIPKDRFLGFYLHDAGYEFGGLWVQKKDEIPYSFVAMNRSEIDWLLEEMIPADPIPGTWLTEWAIWSHVRMYGWASWGPTELPQGKPPTFPNGLGGLKTA